MFLSLDQGLLLKAALIFFRISGIIFALPLFGEKVTPARVKILVSVSLTFGLYGIIPDNWSDNHLSLNTIYFITVLYELLIGLLIGYFGKLFFEGLVMAANLVGYQMGFGTANLMMPGSDLQINAFTALHRILMIVFFLSLSLHFVFIDAIVRSFDLIPVGHLNFRPLIAVRLIEASSEIFRIAMQLGAPILIALMFSMGALGLLARTVPQMNIFTMSFPISFFIGLGVYVSMTPFLPDWLRNFYFKKAEDLSLFIKIMAP